MPIDLYDGIKDTSQWVFGSTLLNNILGNSVALAIIISLLMILLIMFMYPSKKGTSFTIIIKLFVYMFIRSLLVIFLHDGIMKYTLKDEYLNKDNEELMQRTTLGGRENNSSYIAYYDYHKNGGTSNELNKPTDNVNNISNVSNNVMEPPVPSPLTIHAKDTISFDGGNIIKTKPVRNNINPYSFKSNNH